MAKGYPDWFGQSIWPKYGTMLNLTDSMVALGNTEQSVFSITGPGILFSGQITFAWTIGNGDPVIRLYVDDEVAFLYSLHSMAEEGISGPLRSLLSLVNHTVTDRLSVVNVSCEIPFHNTLELTIDPTGALDQYGVDYKMGYYHIV